MVYWWRSILWNIKLFCYSFLASSGLMKTEKVIEVNVQHVVEVEVNGPSTESTKLSLEEDCR
jgi:hypothetical protein